MHFTALFYKKTSPQATHFSIKTSFALKIAIKARIMLEVIWHGHCSLQDIFDSYLAKQATK